MKDEWKEYTGSDEQIAEIKNNKNGYIVRNLNPYDAFILSSRIRYAFELWGDSMVDFEYLICNPHPLADMICQQARTGQPVWIRTIHDEFLYGYKYFNYPPTITPDWNIPNAEYSFTEFKEEGGSMKYKTVEEHFLAQIVIRIVLLHLERSRNYSWLRLKRAEKSKKALELRNEEIARTISMLSDSFKNLCDTPLHRARF